ncbi:MAG: methyltransferase domain-containing protein [Deltaproteobacteria bacterium]
MRPSQQTGGLSSAALQERYGRGYFHGENSGFAAEGYAQQHADWSHWLAFVAREAGEGARWLDLGCAYGFLVEEARAAGFAAFGIDVSHFALGEARSNASGAADLACARGEALPLADRCLDVITAFDILEHVPEPRLLLAECARVLRPGGLLIAATPDPIRFTAGESTHLSEHVPAWWVEAFAEFDFNVACRFFQAPYNLELVARLRGARPSLCWDALGHEDPLLDVGGESDLRVLLREGFETPAPAIGRGVSDGAIVYLLNESAEPLAVEVRARGEGAGLVSLRLAGIERGCLGGAAPIRFLLPQGGHELHLRVEGGWARLETLFLESSKVPYEKLLRTLPFDLYDRYALSAAVETRLRTRPARLLDVGGTMGGAEGHLAWAGDFFTDAEVSVFDTRLIDHPRQFAPESVAGLPFADAAFEVVLSLDVFEHIPPAAREDWLAELWRVCGEFLLLGAPFATAGVAEADRWLYERILRDYGYEHGFLAEHLAYGHPDLAATIAFFRARGASVEVQPSGWLPAWKEAQKISACLSHPTQGTDWLAANAIINEAIGLGASHEPAYRHLLVVDRAGRDLDELLRGLVAREPPSLEPLRRLAAALPVERRPGAAGATAK